MRLKECFPRCKGRLARALLNDKAIRFETGFTCEAFPSVITKGEGSILIGENVTFRKDVEIRATGKAAVIIGSNVKLDRGVRIIATNNSTVEIGDNSAVGLHTVMNGGDSISLGRYSLISGFVYLQTSMHQHEVGIPIRKQGYDHGPIVLEDDVWLGAHVVVMPGVTIRTGSIVGSSSVVTKSIEEGQVVAGVPAKVIRSR